MSWFLVGGAAIGAGAGYMKSQNGGSKDDIWKGALMGGAAGATAGFASGAGALGMGGSTVAGAAAPVASEAGLSTWLSVNGLGGVSTSSLVGGSAGVGAGVGAGAGGGFMASMMSNPGNMASMAGMGMSAINAFGGSSTGSAPSAKIPLTKEAKAGQEAYFNAAKKQYTEASKGILPPNMASIIIGRLRDQAGEASRQMDTVLSASTGVGDTKGGGRAKAALTAAGSAFEGELSPSAWVADARRKNFINSLNSMSNVQNIEAQAPILHASSLLAQSGFEQYQRAQQGEALGAAMEMGGMMTFNGKVMGT